MSFIAAVIDICQRRYRTTAIVLVYETLALVWASQKQVDLRDPALQDTLYTLLVMKKITSNINTYI